MPVPNVGQVVASAWQKMVGTKPEDQIFKEYAFLAWLEDHASPETGGRTLIGPIEYQANGTVKSMASPTETVDTAVADLFDEWEASWKQYSGSFSMTTFEEAINRGDSVKFKLEKAKLDNLRKSFRRDINADLLGNTAGSDLTGLQTLVADSPTTGTVQGISRSTYTFWRNQQTSGAKTTSDYDNLRSAMRTMRTSCAKGQGVKFPTDYWTGPNTSNGFESLLIANERIDDKSDASANAAFSGEKYKFGKANVRWDFDISDSRMYALNRDNLKLAYQTGHYFKGYVPVRPANQLLNVFVVETIIQQYVNNPRHVGVITAIT